MVLRTVIKLMIATGEAFGKAFTRAVREEIKASRHAASANAERQGHSEQEKADSIRHNLQHGISLQESEQILNVKQPFALDEVQKNYDHLFSANSKEKGGSFYLQSKVVCAKERMDDYFKTQNKSDQTDKKS